MPVSQFDQDQGRRSAAVDKGVRPRYDRPMTLTVSRPARPAAFAEVAGIELLGRTCWWPCTGAEVMEQFRRGIKDRINQAVPYSQRGETGRGR